MPDALRVLIVEDDEFDAELLRAELRRGGFQIECSRVETEVALVEMLETQRWDLVLSDFAMPRFNGLHAFEVFRRFELDIPFIFVSGALGEERAVEAMRAGARDYFVKNNLKRLPLAIRRELAEAETRRRQRDAEAVAQREQARLAMAVEASGAGVFEYRASPGTSYCSPRVAEILGYPSGEIPKDASIVEWVRSRVHPDDDRLVVQTYRDFAERRCERYTCELRLRHRSGAWVDVSVLAQAVEREDDGRPTFVVGVLHDLTEHRRLEEQFRQSQKLEAVGRLAGGIAHDFNNLLTVILNFGELVAESLEPSTTAHEDVASILHAAQRAAALTSQLLAFSRRQPISPKVVVIDQIISDVERILRRVVGEDVDIVTHAPEDLWAVRVDPASLEQVILNLAVNARDAMPSGGRLTIETRNEVIDDTYGRTRGLDIAPGEYVLMAVSDTGEGMDEATRQRVFEPFFTTKEVGRGTGLGLSTCFGIVTQAKGYIEVESTLRVGTTFRIHLPRVHEATQDLTFVEEPRVLDGDETIVLVEDDVDVRRLAARVLTGRGYRVLAFGSAEDALSALESSDETIHLLLTDVVMPKTNGPELAARILALRPETEVLFMSGHAADIVEDSGELTIAERLLQKPFTPSLLARRVRQVLDATGAD